MKCKQTRLICAVKGCRNRITYFLTESGDFAGSPNLCKECIQKAYREVCGNKGSTSEKETAVLNNEFPESTNTEEKPMEDLPEASVTPKTETVKTRRTAKKTGGASV